MRELRRFTFLYIPDAERSVRRFRLPRVMLYVVPITIAAAIGGTALYFQYSAMNADYVAAQLTTKFQSETAVLEQERHVLRTDLTHKAQTIVELQNTVITLSSTAEQLQERLNELKDLETNIRTLSRQPVAVTLSSMQQAQSAGGSAIGGEFVRATDEELNQLVQRTEMSYESLTRQIQEVKNSLAQLNADLEQQRARERRLPTIWPVDSRQVTSVFGYRRDPFTNLPSVHNGYDIQAREGDPVYAGADGLVEETGWAADYGYNIILNHGNGIKTRYGHLSKIGVKDNQRVEKGERIGSVGSTGRSTGPHLHYEVLVSGEPVNPRPYLVQDRKEVD